MWLGRALHLFSLSGWHLKLKNTNAKIHQSSSFSHRSHRSGIFKFRSNFYLLKRWLEKLNFFFHLVRWFLHWAIWILKNHFFVFKSNLLGYGLVGIIFPFPWLCCILNWLHHLVFVDLLIMVEDGLQRIYPPLFHGNWLLHYGYFTARKLKVRSEYTIENCLLSSSEIIYVIDSIFIIPSLCEWYLWGFDLDSLVSS